VQVVYGADDFRSVELCPLLWKLSLLRKVKVKLAPVDVLGHQAQPVHGREGIFKLLKREKMSKSCQKICQKFATNSKRPEKMMKKKIGGS
jgi:hypothetical protein